eukprot:m.193321 g.193321  ORF g.193321 m.193321 type:complete len:323 (-) comp18291_c0_seq4:249-1217(-)
MKTAWTTGWRTTPFLNAATTGRSWACCGRDDIYLHIECTVQLYIHGTHVADATDFSSLTQILTHPLSLKHARTRLSLTPLIPPRLSSRLKHHASAQRPTLAHNDELQSFVCVCTQPWLCWPWFRVSGDDLLAQLDGVGKHGRRHGRLTGVILESAAAANAMSFNQNTDTSGAADPADPAETGDMTTTKDFLDPTIERSIDDILDDFDPAQFRAAQQGHVERQVLGPSVVADDGNRQVSSDSVIGANDEVLAPLNLSQLVPPAASVVTERTAPDHCSDEHRGPQPEDSCPDTDANSLGAENKPSEPSTDSISIDALAAELLGL